MSNPPPANRSTAPQESDFSSRLVGLTAARLVLYVGLLCTIAFVYLRGKLTEYPISLRLLLITLGGAFAAAALYAIWLKTRRGFRQLAYTQIAVDQVIWSLVVYLSGGPISPATSLYGLSCVLAAVSLGLRGALAAAMMGAVSFLGLVSVLASGSLRLPADQPPLVVKPLEFVFPSLVTLLALLLVATLSGFLARRLQTESGRVIEVTERAERAERLAALGRIATALAHEIRNPLGSISGAIDLVRESPGLDEDDRKLCEIIRSETDRLSDLVSDMMNLARPRNPTIASVDLASLAADVVQLAQRAGRPITYQGPAHSPIKGDGAQVRQVIWNLVRNAIQASAGASTVSVRVGHGVLEVEDRGAGIPLAMRDHIFDAFVTTRSSGIGIGLAVVKQIVDAHSGSILVKDGAEGGSIFRVAFPT